MKLDILRDKTSCVRLPHWPKGQHLRFAQGSFTAVDLYDRSKRILSVWMGAEQWNDERWEPYEES